MMVAYSVQNLCFLKYFWAKEIARFLGQECLEQTRRSSWFLIWFLTLKLGLSFDIEVTILVGFIKVGSDITKMPNNFERSPYVV